MSVGWLNRIAHALGVEAQDLVASGDTPAELKVAAVIGASGASLREAIVIPPRATDLQIAVTVSSSRQLPRR